MAEDGIEIVRGREVTIRFEARKCIHSRNCVLGRPDVFVPNVQGEWIHPERATRAEVVELAHNCPSGAIRVRALDGAAPRPRRRSTRAGARERPARPACAALDRWRRGGPARHAVPLRRLEAQALVRRQPRRRRLQRQRRATDPGLGERSRAATGRSRSTPAGRPPEGPGRSKSVAGTGRTLNRVTEAWLCRCGASARQALVRRQSPQDRLPLHLNMGLSHRAAGLPPRPAGLRTPARRPGP